MYPNLSISEAQQKHLDQQVQAFVQALSASRLLSDQYQTLVDYIRQIGLTELQQFQSINARFMAQSFSKIEQRHTNADVLIRRFAYTLNKITQPTIRSLNQGERLIRHLRAEWSELQQHVVGLTRLQSQIELERLGFTYDLGRVYKFLGRLLQLEYLVVQLTTQLSKGNWITAHHPLLSGEKGRVLEILRQKQQQFEVYKVTATQHAEMVKLVLSNQDQMLSNLTHMQTVQTNLAQSALWSKGLAVSLSEIRTAFEASVDDDTLIQLCHQQQALLNQFRDRLTTERQHAKKLIQRK